MPDDAPKKVPKHAAALSMQGNRVLCSMVIHLVILYCDIIG